MYPYFDAHCDTLCCCAEKGLSLWENQGHLDLRRLREYSPVGQVFALFLNSGEVPPEGRMAVLLEQVEIFQRAKEAHPEIMDGCCLSLEGAELINCDEELLPKVKAWGVRWVNLTWNYANALSGSCLTGGGLTESGRAFAKRCWGLGMGIDVSHLSDQGFWDIQDIREGAVLASHSNSRALCDHPRNLTDEMAKALIAGDGYIGLNFYTRFLGEPASAEQVIAHLEHFLDLGGEDHVGLGTDFDGADVPADLAGVEALPHLWEALYRRNYPERLMEKIAYRNLSNFLEKNHQ